MTAHALRLLARDCHALADRMSHRDRWTRAHHDAILTMLNRCEHALLTALVDVVVAQPKPREATTRSGGVHRLRYR
jgi:hypothetical protein